MKKIIVLILTSNIIVLGISYIIGYKTAEKEYMKELKNFYKDFKTMLKEV